MKQSQQQEMLRQMRPEMSAQQYQAQAFMRNMQNTQNMTMAMKQQHQTNLARAAMANNQNPGMQQMLQAKQNPMQRDPSGMDANRDRPSSPASGENAPSPSKRQRIDGAPFNANQPGAMMNGGRPGQNMPGQPMAVAGNVANAQQVLAANGINPSQLNPQQMQNFANTPPAAQQKSIATYSHNLQQHHGNQINNKQMVPQNQSSPMMAPGGPDGNALNAFYNPNMDGPNAMRAGGQAQPTGSNHALQDYQMQLMLLEQQNKKRLMMARQEQSDMGGIPRDSQPGVAGPNGQPFPDTSPQAMRSGASPNPAEQMKRGTPQMNNSGISSPVPDGAQSRESPNPAMNFLGNHVNVSMAPHFYKGGADENMAAAQAQMNGMRPPSSHPGQPFNGPMNAQQMMAARGVPGNPQQWQPGMNGQMVPGGMPQQGQPVQGTPQQRSMPPPSAPAAANANNRTTASPQQAAAAPPTPSQSNKAAPKKKESKSAKDKVSPCSIQVSRLRPPPLFSHFSPPFLQSDRSYSDLLHRRRVTRTTTMPLLLPRRMAQRPMSMHRQLPSPQLSPLEASRPAKLAAPRQMHLRRQPPRVSQLLLLRPVRRYPRRLLPCNNPPMTWLAVPH